MVARNFFGDFSCFLLSIMIVVVMLQVMDSVELNLRLEFQNQILGDLRIDKDKVDESCKLIMELTRTRVEGNPLNKHKFSSIPESSNGVKDLFFNSDRSNDSWTISLLTLSSSTEPVSKKFKTQQEHFLDRRPYSTRFSHHSSLISIFNF
ncbi:hypothetical protein GQ457_13G009010 [Hibiscus cannabinus]